MEEKKSQKKKRAENWSTEEKEVPRRLITESKNVIEDKSNKASATIVKNEEWKKITIKFNEIMGKSRKADELKVSWKTMKLKAKSKMSAYRREVGKTGGGGKPPSPTQEELEIMDIAPHDFVVEINNFDSDAMSPSAAEVPAMVEEVEVTAAPEKPKGDNITMETEDMYAYHDLGPSNSGPSNINRTKEDNVEVQVLSKDPKRNKAQGKSKKINKNEDMRLSIVTSNAEVKKRQLEIMEAEHLLTKEEHCLTKKIKLLKIKKLEMEISILENQIY